MFKFKQPTPHLGPMGINSPGYGVRPGTPEHEEVQRWTKEYWDKLTAHRVTENEKSVNKNV